MSIESKTLHHPIFDSGSEWVNTSKGNFLISVFLLCRLFDDAHQRQFAKPFAFVVNPLKTLCYLTYSELTGKSELRAALKQLNTSASTVCSRVFAKCLRRDIFS